MNPIKKTIALPDGRTITLETGKLAKQADGAVELRMGNTMLLATVVTAKEAGEGVDFMPLQVEYKEKFSSNGRFPGGFLKREGRASDYEILTSRLVDRVLRPLFPDNYHADTFVQVTMYSSDGVDMPDALAGLAASAAIAVSDIPFNGPISEVRVARVNGEFVIDPTFEQLEKADMELMVGATYDNIMMVEGEMNEVSEADLLAALRAAHDAIKVQCKAQMELAEEVGSTVKREYCHETNDEDLRKDVHDKCYDKAYAVAKAGCADKHWRQESFEKICEEYLESLPEEERDEKTAMVKRYYHDVEKEAMRRCVLDEGIRLDGRKTTEIRPIWCEVDYLPGPHGSAVFTRGETQSLATVTLGTKLDEKILDDVLNQGRERFLLHYNFPPFSTGEARPVRGVGRREVGHGNLAHRALKRMFPDDFPYVCRIVSDILESNGSSSMATVCAGTLSLLDAGVKMKRPVSGIAMGLISDGTKYAVLSDILGDEDHLGDMDFKVTGTREGITATQMDIKCDGLSYEILEKALNQAKEGRLHILDKIEETIPAAREDYKPHVPRIVTMLIPKELIGAVIGPGGKIIQGIQEASGATVSIDEIPDGGYIEVAASNKASIDKALDMINAIVELPEEGKVYHGKVRSILDFGAFVEFMPNRDGLLHISEISWDRLENMEAAGLKEGDELEVKLIEIDKKTGKYRLSMRALQPKPEGYVERERAPRGERGPRREGDRPRRDGDRGPRRDGDRGPRRENNGGNHGAPRN
ncbi:polyribonucleotide nucleotidyltransferase [Duncaniella muris]|jgi:polyribonucleotide nucleotidyltransferase|uniref:Polyribonucleotide nucleotidyltransferase n=14 Tax=Duncaniella muris TaxID=2094150 RepID=A0A2V1IJ41_9BACT|nr:polyribonucleotide nucleotidyltransferase [Duncaniella muris]ROS91347.1 polyribonucleotide nucleotidyltransferase [Muribaculaceae bacterium Isolate-039 (Harlan)]ROS95944.1 polyribonucleotide nucleotidyltransferase [Muribaculaceae bacterium Isolate-077 (Janvier)]ROS96583.1 polyribonucleotide nucleotidyltransferase [Muribaculaceae bacterium Isolate-083 (Janvier)]ROS99386.1 polyribonucleotide nucleotidyltransferase [Muribaculaceae bacterium Isolate-084 (Janvier)]PWB01425.1 polyribonucleotide n